MTGKRASHAAGRSASHSQTVTTFQPSRRSSRALRRSRSTLLRNFACQNAVRDLGAYAKRHPQWRCQKQPWTNTTVRYLGSTMSGRPGRSRQCRRNRYPARCSAERTSRSGSVSRSRIRDMFQLRRSRDSLSVTPHSPRQRRSTSWTMPAIWAASRGGTALPTWRYCSVRGPSK